ncbi:hypothetical protein GCK32_003232 [Trichostrongylus colubriformis]|uniref:Tudor domain-containing protein n=1 Tax=Trichostrongylus colubriformis TaxID=6319 RepID=A0AAN8ES52_TRICO
MEQNRDRFDRDLSEIFVPVACTCLVRGEWCRAKISKLNGNSSVLVELVDYGTEVFSNLSNVRPLLLKFGRIPPMALKCRVKDVYINDLNAKKVEEFRRIIDECNRLVRVELLTATEPYFINIFHPTLKDENIGKLFYTPVEDENHDLAKERRWLDHIRRQNSEDDDYFETNEESDYEVDYGVEHLYIRRFPRSPKPSHVGTDELFVGHIENSRLIYLQLGWMITRRKEIENSIAEQWCRLPKLPSKWLNMNTACAAHLGGSFYRASITRILADSIQMLLIDDGRHVFVDKLMADLRVLPSTDLYVEPPMVMVTSLDIDSEPFPHPSCTVLLRKILPAGTQVQFLPDKRHKRSPPRGKLFVVESSLDVERHLCQRLRETGVQLQCRELVPFQSDNPWLKYRSAPDTKFIHRLQCPSVLLRGKLELAPLESITTQGPNNDHQNS